METDVSKLKEINWNGLPKCLVGSDPLEIGSAGEAVGQYVSSGMSSVGRSMSNAVDRAAHTPYSLAVFLNTRVYAGKQAHKRSRYWWGRFYNKYSGDHAYYIKLKGLHLIQTLRIIDKVPQDKEIPVAANCAIRLDFAADILQELQKQLADKTE